MVYVESKTLVSYYLPMYFQALSPKIKEILSILQISSVHTVYQRHMIWLILR